MPRLPLLLLALAALSASAVAAEMNVGGHFQDFDEVRKVIDARCTICHTRERVEAAAREGKELAPIQQRMIERGAVLTDPEKEVLGTFWGSPTKRGGEPREPDVPAH